MKKTFELHSKFDPIVPQQEAIDELVNNINSNITENVLLGVTGSGKTFTVANVIKETGKPTLVMCHNKTLASQLYGEFREFFPNNRVEYYVSYFDYYRPESYNVTTGKYLEKDSLINEDIKQLRMSAIASILHEPENCIIVASVSAIYATGNPDNYLNNKIELYVNQNISRTELLKQLVKSLYSRSNNIDEFKPGTFFVKGDTITIKSPTNNKCTRISFFGDEIDSIDILTKNMSVVNSTNSTIIYPAEVFVTDANLDVVLNEIDIDLQKQIAYFNNENKPLEAKRIEERTKFDMDMIQELGYCTGIENYSAYFDGIYKDTRPYTLLDYFPKDFLLVLDESHATIPQIKSVHGGYMQTKYNLIENGFRLPSSAWTRPLKFDEFISTKCNKIYVSATPGDYELEKTLGIYTDLVIRPTGLLEPPITIKPTDNCVDDALEEITVTIENGNRCIVNTLTKRMAEEFHKYLTRINVKSHYLHSDIDTLDRIERIKDYRLGDVDVLIGVNLLREGLDLPETELVMIFDADKEGFLRSYKTLTQLAGRSARNKDGRCIMYADKITNSMQKTIDECNRRRNKQNKYNNLHNITPTTIISKIGKTDDLIKKIKGKTGTIKKTIDNTPKIDFNTLTDKEKNNYIKSVKQKMEVAAKELNFVDAAKYRDVLKSLQANK